MGVQNPSASALIGLSLLLFVTAGNACSVAPAGAPPVATSLGDSVDIVIAGTTDSHGRLRAWDYYRNTAEPSLGLTRLATVVDSVRAANPGRVLLLDAGD